MRSVLTLAVHLLALVVISRACSNTEERGVDRTAPDHGLSILCAGKGVDLPPAPFPGGEETVLDAIMIGDMILVDPKHRPGLRVALLAPGLAFEAFEVFALASSAKDAEAFLALAGDQPVGAIMALTQDGSIHPGEEIDSRTRLALAAALRELGAETEPLAADPSSWAMITVRRPQGWVKLAEAHSTDQGVVLAFTVHSDLARYDNHRGEVARRNLNHSADSLED